MSEAVIGGDAAWLGSKALPLARGLTNLGSSSNCERSVACIYVYFVYFDYCEWGARSRRVKRREPMMMQAKEAFAERLPDQVEIENADSLRRILASQVNGDEAVELSLALGEKQIEPVTLAPALAASLMELLRLVSSGRGFRMIPVDAELTTQQAADLLNVSRPHLVKLLEEGEIAFFKTGRHRRVKAADLFEYKKKRDIDRSDALSDLAAMDMENDLL
ncbi:helix-turn-helix domain-containing protein [Amaricoccus tamworthensis]|uniref:helix-turn-helix domain-containing protein n=1 Tax=Amaricoccus tamworthensis TaxID=57002 RepID=UPI003C7D9F91